MEVYLVLLLFAVLSKSIVYATASTLYTKLENKTVAQSFLINNLLISLAKSNLLICIAACNRDKDCKQVVYSDENKLCIQIKGNLDLSDVIYEAGNELYLKQSRFSVD